MKKRLRKKLNLGEFKETGFKVSWKFNAAVDETDIDRFFDAFVDTLVTKGLFFEYGGGAEDEFWEGVIAKQMRHTCTDASDRAFITEWLKSLNNIQEFSVGDEDIDLWYSRECCCC